MKAGSLLKLRASIICYYLTTKHTDICLRLMNDTEDTAKERDCFCCNETSVKNAIIENSMTFQNVYVHAECFTKLKKCCEESCVLYYMPGYTLNCSCCGIIVCSYHINYIKNNDYYHQICNWCLEHYHYYVLWVLRNTRMYFQDLLMEILLYFPRKKIQ